MDTNKNNLENKDKKMNIQWYPGHMTKAKRQMQEDIKLIDIVIELLDARVPLSSRNPDIDDIAKNKFRLVLLNKADLADDSLTDEWIEYFKNKNIVCIKINSQSGKGVKQINNLVKEVCKEKIERDRKRGILNRPIRAMVVGIPNVGKSTFINSYAGRSAAKTGNKPGVTRGKQWIRLGKDLELLDTPGILWPKFEDKSVGLKLAYIGSIKDEIINTTELCLDLIEYLTDKYNGILSKRFEIDEGDKISILKDIAIKRGCKKKGDEVDFDKAALLILDDFRSGRLGKITLERP